MRYHTIGLRSWWSLWSMGLVVLGIGWIAMGTIAVDEEDEARSSPHANTSVDPFQALNEEFRVIYSASRTATLDQTTPILLVSGDTLVLRHDGQREAVRVIPDAFHRLKVVAHLPLAVYLAIGLEGGKPAEAESQSALKLLRERAREVHAALGDHEWTQDQRERQERLIAASLELLNEAIEHQAVDRARILAFARAMGPLLLANVDDAVRLVIDAYDAQLLVWKAQVPSEDWERLRVVVQGGPMPRQDNLAVQYFARRLGLPGECAQLVYAESMTEEDQALNLLATHRLDRDFSGDFFGDPTIMERDLQATATAEYLDQLTFEL